jgi:hypothetical protein
LVTVMLSDTFGAAGELLLAAPGAVALPQAAAPISTAVIAGTPPIS